MLWLRLQRSDSKERAGLTAYEDGLRGLVQHSCGSSGKSLGFPEGEEIIVFGHKRKGRLAELSNSMHS